MICKECPEQKDCAYYHGCAVCVEHGDHLDRDSLNSTCHRCHSHSEFEMSAYEKLATRCTHDK